MKNKINILFTTLIFAGASLLYSCSKDGETGPAGANGTNGINGENGTNGANGITNVKRFNYTVVLTDWTIVSSSNIQVKLDCIGITQAILDSGMVLVYWDANNSAPPNTPNFVPLPVPFFTNVKSRILTCSWQLNTNGLGQITINIRDMDGLSISIPSTIYFKAVVVSSHMRIANPNLNGDNYNEVKAALHLQD